MTETERSRTGASIVYEPTGCDPIVDVVFIHGLQGHPFKTWTYQTKLKADSQVKEAKKPEEKASLSSISSQTCKTKSQTNWHGLEKLMQGLKGIKNRAKTKRSPETGVFWPRDLLPVNCPKARVIVLGYDTVVAKLPSKGRANRNSIFTHSKDLLNELSRVRPSGRRIIFVAHSLGGILVKEMLANCSTSNFNELQDILASTSAVIFLGTPHRGSPAASLGVIAEKTASLLLLDTNPSVIDSLALKNADLSRCQDIFSSLWAKHDFQVKSFQEGLVLKSKRLLFTTLREKVVPDFSSCLGDPRERAETLNGDHREICRFSGVNCPNYKKVSGELVRIYLQLEAVVCDYQAFKPNYTSSTEIFRLLRFPGMQNRFKFIGSPLYKTCTWLPQVELYKNWISREKIREHRGLLQVIGKPGSGKSTVMKRAFEQVRSEFSGTTTCVTGFFFNKRGNILEHSSLGMFRSLLHQMLQFHPRILHAVKKLQEQELQEEDDGQISDLHLPRLRDIFQELFINQQNDIRTIIFVDALDECHELGGREIAYFFRQLTDSACSAGVQLDVCLSRRDFPTLCLNDCPEIKLEMFTRGDIEHYISNQFEFAGLGDSDTIKEIRRDIAGKANGIFLWVILVVEKIIKERDNGRNEMYLLGQTSHLPTQLDSLYIELLGLHKMSKSELQITLRLFQWAVLSTSPLRIREWHHILAFIQEEPPKSLSKWKKSIYYTATDEQLEKQIRAISRGLVEVKIQHVSTISSELEDIRSVGAGAGSLDSVSGESRVVQLIHESVRAFFFNGGQWLSDALKVAECPRKDITSFCAEGHVALMKGCFHYLAIEELKEYSEARLAHSKQRERVLDGATSPSLSLSLFLPFHSKPALSLETASFGSSASGHDMAFTWSIDTNDIIPGDNMTVDNKSVNSGIMESLPSSAMSKIHVLDDYPALESYATNRVFFHARLAQDHGADPMPIIRLLHEGCYWRRWLGLQENITRTNSLLVLALEQSLDTWVKCILECSSLQPSEKELNSALLFAIHHRRFESIRTLIVHGAQIELGEALEHEKTRQTLVTALEEIHDKDKTILSAILFYAIRSSDTELALNALNFGPDIHEKNDRGLTPLHLLAQKARYHSHCVLRQLISCGADVRAEDIQGRTPFHLIAGICTDGDSRNSAPYNFKEDENGITILIEKLVTAGADVNATSPSGWTPLHYIVNQYGDEDFIQDLISAGADINAKDDAGLTPLHHSLGRARGRGGLTEGLIANGADIDAEDDHRRTPIDMLFEDFESPRAVYSTIRDINALIAARIPIDTTRRDMRGRTPLHKAIIASEWELIEILLLHGADINEKDYQGRTALHMAFALSTKCKLNSDFWDMDEIVHIPDERRERVRRMKLCDKLLDFGPDVSAKTNTGLTVLHIAADAEFSESIERTVLLGAGVDERDHLGRTALHFAAAKGYVRMVKALLQVGANACILDEAGTSPLRVAHQRTDLESVVAARVICAHLQGIMFSSCHCAVREGHIADT